MATSPKPVTVIDYYPDFSKLLTAGLLSDVNVIIREEARDHEAEPVSKRPRFSTSLAPSQGEAKTVAAHRVILWSLSAFFQAKVTVRACR